MNEALCSILSAQDEWCYGTEQGPTIKFNKDGTGESVCRWEHWWWIAAELEWRSIEPLDSIEGLDSVEGVEPLDQIVDIRSATWNKSPHILGQLNLEITLIKRMPQWAQNSAYLTKSTLMNELSLNDDAFRPKSYNIRLEKDNFIVPCCIGSENSHRPRYALRLVFDKSPYPPRSEWSKPEGGPESNNVWDYKEFVARRSPESDKKERATNDLPL